MAAGVVHKNLPHQPGGDAKEMSAPLPLRGVHPYQTQIGFIHQGCALQRVVRAFLTQPEVCNALELLVDNRQKGIQSFAVSRPPAVQ
jgi:hypothetical protein